MIRAIFIVMLASTLVACTANIVFVWRRTVPALGERMPSMDIRVPDEPHQSIVIKEDSNGPTQAPPRQRP